MSQYYYWLIPDEPHRSNLKRIIQRFSKIYQSPIFTPHITVGSGNSIPTTIQGTEIPQVQFARAATEHTYFRSLYFKCEPSPTLLSICKYFGREDPFIPHLSLIYGHFSDARERDWCTNTPQYKPKVSCSTIWIVRGGRKVQDWQKIKSFSLQ